MVHVVVIVQNKGILLHYRLDDQSNAFRQCNLKFLFFYFLFLVTFFAHEEGDYLMTLNFVI